MRDRLKTPEYWQAQIADNKDFVGEVYNDLINSDETFSARRNDASFLLRTEFDLVSGYYSSGAPIAQCVEQARKMLLEGYVTYVDVCRLSQKEAYEAEAGGYDFRTRYLALAILCRLTPDEARPLVEAIDFWPERDAVWERFIAFLGLVEGRTPVNSLVWPDAYAPLLEALDPEGSDFTRQAALQQFDKNWLRQMRTSSNPRYSNHNNKHNTYTGYWNFEAAAAAVAMKIDDGLLDTSETYPKDWADWAWS